MAPTKASQAYKQAPAQAKEQAAEQQRPKTMIKIKRSPAKVTKPAVPETTSQKKKPITKIKLWTPKTRAAAARAALEEEKKKRKAELEAFYDDLEKAMAATTLMLFHLNGHTE